MAAYNSEEMNYVGHLNIQMCSNQEDAEYTN